MWADSVTVNVARLRYAREERSEGSASVLGTYSLRQAMHDGRASVGESQKDEGRGEEAARANQQYRSKK